PSFFFSSRRRHTRSKRDWSSDVCSSDLSNRRGPLRWSAMEPSGVVWSDFSFVAASGYRERVLNALSRKPKFPKDVARETTLRITHVSRALREMGGRGLVECLKPEAKASRRLYGEAE